MLKGLENPSGSHLRKRTASTLQHSLAALVCHVVFFLFFVFSLSTIFYISSSSQHLITVFANRQVWKRCLGYKASSCFKIPLMTAACAQDGCIYLSNDLKNQRNAKYYLNSLRNGCYSSFK